MQLNRTKAGNSYDSDEWIVEDEGSIVDTIRSNNSDL